MPFPFVKIKELGEITQSIRKGVVSSVESFFEKNSWEWQKKLNELIVIRRLFFTSFTVILSLLLTKPSILLGAENLESKLLTASLVGFYFSACLWFVANFIFSIRIPRAILVYKDIYDFLSGQRAIFVENTSPESSSARLSEIYEVEVKWEGVREYKVETWARLNTQSGRVERLLISIFQLLAVLVFFYALLLFCQGIDQFLLGLGPSLWPL